MRQLIRPPEEMLTLELVERYSPVYPEGYSWEKTVAYLYAEQAGLMEELAASLKKTGWREPVLLSEPHETTSNRQVVFDGTHRVAIALKEGILAVPVVTNSHYEDEISGVQQIITVSYGEGKLTFDEEGDVQEHLRSFKVSEDYWFTSELSVSHGSSTKIFTEGLPEELYDRTRRRVMQLLRDSFPTKSFQVSVTSEAY